MVLFGLFKPAVGLSFLAIFLSRHLVASSIKVVCIDPGHPSEVGSGATGRTLTEVKANWTEALLLRSRLERAGIRVVLTKSSEKEFVPNKRRADIANQAHANLMIRLHCDAAKGSGFTTYVPLQAGSDQGYRGPSHAVIFRSRSMGESFHSALARELKGMLPDNGIKGDQATSVGSLHGALIGSIYSKVPVVLVEMVVLTNPIDETFLLSKRGQDSMADALAAGVLSALRAK